MRTAALRSVCLLALLLIERAPARAQDDAPGTTPADSARAVADSLAPPREPLADVPDPAPFFPSWGPVWSLDRYQLDVLSPAGLGRALARFPVLVGGIVGGEGQEADAGFLRGWGDDASLAVEARGLRAPERSARELDLFPLSAVESVSVEPGLVSALTAGDGPGGAFRLRLAEAPADTPYSRGDIVRGSRTELTRGEFGRPVGPARFWMGGDKVRTNSTLRTDPLFTGGWSDWTSFATHVDFPLEGRTAAFRLRRTSGKRAPPAPVDGVQSAGLHEQELELTYAELDVHGEGMGGARWRGVAYADITRDTRRHDTGAWSSDHSRIFGADVRALWDEGGGRSLLLGAGRAHQDGERAQAEAWFLARGEDRMTTRLSVAAVTRVEAVTGGRWRPSLAVGAKLATGWGNAWLNAGRIVRAASSDTLFPHETPLHRETWKGAELFLERGDVAGWRVDGALRWRQAEAEDGVPIAGGGTGGEGVATRVGFGAIKLAEGTLLAARSGAVPFLRDAGVEVSYTHRRTTGDRLAGGSARLPWEMRNDLRLHARGEGEVPYIGVDLRGDALLRYLGRRPAQDGVEAQPRAAVLDLRLRARVLGGLQLYVLLDDALASGVGERPGYPPPEQHVTYGATFRLWN